MWAMESVLRRPLVDRRRRLLLLLLLLVRAQRRKRLGLRRRGRAALAEGGRRDRLSTGIGSLAHLDCFRVSPEQFEQIVVLVSPHVGRYRKTLGRLSATQALAITLRYLATGDMRNSPWEEDAAEEEDTGAMRVERTWRTVQEICLALWDVLCPRCLPRPTASRWRQVSEGFWREKGFPNCVGGVEGRSVVVQSSLDCPSTPSNGSSRSSSDRGGAILLAAADARCRFTLVDVGMDCSSWEGSVFTTSTFGRALEEETLDLPLPRPLPGTSTVMPHVFATDELLPLKCNLMRPYPSRKLSSATSSLPLGRKCALFNQTLSRAREPASNALGVLVARWRLFQRPLLGTPQDALAALKAACCLHNFLLLDEQEVDDGEERYCPSSMLDRVDSSGKQVPGSWRFLVPGDGGAVRRVRRHIGSNSYTLMANGIRETFAEFFLSQQQKEQQEDGAAVVKVEGEEEEAEGEGQEEGEELEEEQEVESDPLQIH